MAQNKPVMGTEVDRVLRAIGYARVTARHIAGVCDCCEWDGAMRVDYFRRMVTGEKLATIGCDMCGAVNAIVTQYPIPGMTQDGE